MSRAALISAEGAAFRYPGQRSAVGPFDFEAHAGEFHLVSGPSGCGKSTLARIFAGLIPHLYRGQLDGLVRIAGRRSDAVPLWELSTLVGLVSQNPAAQLLASTVKDEIVFGLENLGLPADEVETRAAAALTCFGLQALAAREPRTLSGGEQQQVVLAAIAARRPQALVLDEPLAMLDSASAQAIVAHLDSLSHAGAAIVAFEHRPARFAHLPHLKRRRLASADSADPPLPALPNTVPAFRLIVEGLGVELGGRAVLKGIDLTLSGGRVSAVVGANGSGKTTLLRTLAGLQPHSGRITGTPSQPRLGLCFQNPDRQIFNPTVRQEIRFGLGDCDEALYRSVVTALGLAAYENTPPLLLSEGEKKRLALATLLLQPGLCGICLDEPTLGQDPHYRRLLGRITRRLADAGYLCLVATHDLAWAAEWADQLLMLHEGRLVASGDPQSILRRPDHTDLHAPETPATQCTLAAPAL